MADVLRIKRRVSGGTGAPPTLANAELAYNEVDHTLYYGEGTGGGGGSATVIRAIGGDGLLTGLSTVYQPLDADLTSLAGASATGAMYYRSAANTWATVTIGTGLTFTTGTLAATGGGGNVSNSGTPTLGQLAVWLNANQIQGYNVNVYSISSWSAPTADVPWNSKKITGLLDPISQQDAATKNYVDNVAQGLSAKASVFIATTANITLSGVQSIDNVAVIAGQRVLVKNQTDARQNGIYLMASGAWARSPDADTWNELIAAYCFVEQGETNADTGWLCIVDAGGSLGVMTVDWTQFSSVASVTAGSGLTKTGNTINVIGTAGRISVSADAIDIDGAYLGQTSIATLGTVGTGVWNASTIGVNKGGTSMVSFTAGYIKSPGGTSPLNSTATIPNTDITGLGTMSTQAASAVAITGGTIDGVTFDCGTF